jgi:hypothetical protein
MFKLQTLERVRGTALPPCSIAVIRIVEAAMFFPARNEEQRGRDGSAPGFAPA